MTVEKDRICHSKIGKYMDDTTDLRIYCGICTMYLHVRTKLYCICQPIGLNNRQTLHGWIFCSFDLLWVANEDTPVGRVPQDKLIDNR